MSLGKRRSSAWLGRALIASGVLHAGVIASFWVASSRGAEVPPLKVYAVNIVSPPPAAAGEPQPGETAAAPEPTVVAEPEPTPPAPAPDPAPPAPAPPQRQTPRPAPRAPAPKPEPSPPARPTTKAAAPEPQRPPAPSEPKKVVAAEPAKPAATPASRPAQTQPSAPAAKPAETPARSAPSTGPSPAPSAAPGEGLAIKTEGAVCPSDEYCNNIARQVQRYFRRPSDSRADRGDVCFRIARNGSVEDIDVQRLRGGFAFRLALMEAVEQAALRNEFGPLPRSFGSDWLPVCVGVSPQA